MAHIALRSWHLILAVPAVFFLTGAKGNGCGGTVEPPPEPQVHCPAGYHVETFCEDDVTPVVSDSNGEPQSQPSCVGSGTQAHPTCIGPEPEPGCHQECVPDDDVCPPGTELQEECVGSASYCIDSDSGDSYCEPSEEECFVSCVPICPDGTQLEYVCSNDDEPEPPPLSGSGDSGSESGMAEPLPGDCDWQCIPASSCYEVCVDSADPDGAGDLCWIECSEEEPQPLPEEPQAS